MSTVELPLDISDPNSLGVRGRVPARYLGRQPIVDEKSRLYGYELLFRAGLANHFSGDPELATQEVVDHWMMLMPEPDETVAFVNCTRDTLVDGLVSILSPTHTVLEILETVNPDPALMKTCADLRKQGYRFALDDFFPDPRRAPLLEIADFVKIDFRASSPAIRNDIYKMLDGSWALRIAEKIETEEEMRVARGEGCLLFQGYFFSRPVLLTTHRVPQNRLVYLRLLAALHDVPANLAEVESLVMSDASLCYRLLRLANSALQGHAGVISSVREALLLVGDDAVRRMVTVALAGVLSGHRPVPLVSMALARARFCELVAPALQQQASELYLLGILSLLDALLETPMPRILKTLPICTEMKAALLGEPGGLSIALDLVRSLETCDWQQCETLRLGLGLTESAVSTMYVDSLSWVARALQG
jgi:EAL and modified HD-GYP domain-containing signal transduction protein